jgi:hypothetical protein
MIIQENITVNGVDLVRTYSDTYTIRQVETGIVYIEAIDIPNRYTYEETEELKPEELKDI